MRREVSRRLSMRGSLRGRVIVLAATGAVLASLAVGGVLAEASGARNRAGVSNLNVSEFLPPRQVTDASKGQLSIANGSTTPIECKVPRYRNGALFQVDYQSTRSLAAADVSGDKVINEVTCQDKRISGLNVRPDTDAEDVDYLANGTFKRSGYIYLHADLRPEFANVCRSTAPSDEFVPWAESAKGFCGGDFVGGNPPFNNTAGLSIWRVEGPGKPINVETALGTYKDYDPHPGVHFDCVVDWRGSDACYSQQSQVGKTPNSIGGPLYIDVHLGQAVKYAYLLIHGWCEKSDGNCMPNGG